MSVTTKLQVVTDSYEAPAHEHCPGCRRLMTEALALRKALNSLGSIADAMSRFDEQVGR